MELYHHIFKTNFGFSALEFKLNPFQVNKIYLPQKNEKQIKAVLNKDSIYGEDEKANQVAQIIQAYFNGQIINHDQIPWHLLPLDNYTELQQKVYNTAALIPYGQVKSYGSIAKEIGKSGASRFVGSCMAKNPFPVLIPCHRVIRSDGSMGGFGGGTEMKKKMQKMEKKGKT